MKTPKYLIQMLHTQVFSLVQIVLGFVLLSFLVSGLSVEDYAQYVLIQGFMAVFLLLFSMNLYTYTRLHIPGASIERQYGYLKTVIVIVLGAYATTASILYASNSAEYVLGLFSISPELTLLVVAMVGLELVILEILRFFIAIKLISVKNYAATLQKVLVSGGCLYLISINNISVERFLGCFIFTQLIVLGYLLANLNLKRLMLSNLLFDVFKHGFKVGIPLLPIGLISVSMNYMDTLMIGRFIGQAEVANYGLASQIVNIAMMMIGTSVVLTLFPYATEAHNKGLFKERNSFFNKMTFYGILLSVIFFLLAPNSSTLVISYFELSQYESVSHILGVLAIFPLFGVLYTVSSHRLQLLNHFSVQVYLAFSVIVLNFVLNFYAIRVYGVIGAAYASLCSYIILSLMFFIVAFKISSSVSSRD